MLIIYANIQPKYIPICSSHSNVVSYFWYKYDDKATGECHYSFVAEQRMFKMCVDCDYWSVAKIFFRSSLMCESLCVCVWMWFLCRFSDETKRLLAKWYRLFLCCGLNFYHSHSTNVSVYQSVCVAKVRKSFQKLKIKNEKEEEILNILSYQWH